MLPGPVGQKTPRRRELQAEDLASVLQHLEEEFAAGERLADEQTWCMPVPRARQVRTVQRFYRAFHDAGTLPVLTCKGLTPVEEKLISLNSCYGFVTRYSIPGGQRQSVRYPRHVKGHITVFPNDVQGLVTKVLPHPLVRVMDEIHVSWQGAEKPGPRDLSGLLSVRRRAVERALVWLKENNPLYGEVEIDVAEMESWGAPPHGVPSVVCERLERNEPSARERTRTAQVVPPTERAMDDEGAVEIEEILVMLSQGRDPAERSRDVRPTCDDEEDGARPEEGGEVINEVTSSGMFPLDGPPGVADAEKIRFARDAVGPDGARARAGPRTWVRRGNEFADSADASFFAKTFPTLFPFGVGGPRLADEAATRGSETTGWRGRAAEAERVAEGLTSTRNMNLQAWADVVLRRHGGRFATHPIFAFLVFNMGVRSRNRQASMLGVTRKNFAKVEGLLKSLTTQRLEAARVELEATGKTGDDGVKELLRSLSVFGHRQPMSRESRLSMRKKILSLIVRYGVPAIWFTLNPNDITNPVKLRLAAYRARDPEAAEAFLRELGTAYKRVRLAIADPMSAAVFFHREIKLFFEHYVDVGDESVFGHVGAYYGAALAGAGGEEQAAYRERIIRYVDSVFSEELDAEGHHAVQAERSITAHMSSWLDDVERLTDAFDEEANFCAGATQVHTHSATCVKYSLAGAGRKGDLCRFKAPWRLVERTALTADGVLEIRRTHSMVNRWNKAMAVGLRHNHDISFIATQRKTMALIYYITNYATKVEDPTWKRVAAAAELLPTSEPTAESSIPSADRNDSGGNGAGEEAAADPIRGNKTRVFLLKAANRIFTERPLSQVEVIADLLGYPAEFCSGAAWAYVNTNQLYWAVFRQWRHLRLASGVEATASDAPDETVVVEEAGPRISFIEAYRHRGGLLQGLCLYDYASLVRLKRNGGGAEGCAAWGEIPFNESWAPGKDWAQVLRRPGKGASVRLDGYLSKEFGEEDEESCHRRAAVQHLALFVPWEAFVCEETGDINDIWARERAALAPRIARLADNVQLLRRSAEDAKRDARQWAATTEEGEPAAAARANEGAEEAAEGGGQVYRAGGAGDAARLIDVVRNAAGAGQVTARSAELLAMTQQLCRFQQSALSSAAELDATVVAGEAGPRRVILAGRPSPGELPRQEQSIALLIICRQLDQARQGGDAGDSGDAGQLCLFVGGEGGTGKSRVIEALVELFAQRDLSSQLLITATSGTAAARINGITLHSACGLLVGQGGQAGSARRSACSGAHAARGERAALPAAGSPRDFGGIPVVILCGDFHQFRPVQERSILLPSAAVPWDADGAFAAERRRQHDKAHALWRKFTTVVMLDEQMRAAGDPELRRLLGRIRRGEQDRSDLDLLNSRCYRAGRRIPWETGVTVVTPLNRNRWNLNLEAALAFRARQRTAARIFVSEHKWRDGTPTEEEAVLMLGQGDDSATPVPAVFLFVPGMPVVVNQNTHQGLKLVNGAGYTAVDVIPDRAFPGHRVSAELTMHFGPPPEGLPCAAAFACTDYKVQGGTLERVALELRGARTTTVDGRAVPSPCDPYSLYVQLSRCPTLDGIMLVSEVRRGTW
ncbi:PIF1-like helicase [Hirsutella rhossiliensis]|uniref:PIF1-like helicase domain-containing protein n=1 Tax=Hirsutella rhossiliensis TaxID=111463 RepID=A0A9P8MU69_9HYPO|nr:PIF1-like helicase domain-containing protein [Hirsutella rhossiliensis]KAH0959277.1 PIF1-like helicase domain-containing protein [Hirsutella rhossiliensis]